MDVLGEYDYIILDTNPSMGIVNQNAFMASDKIILLATHVVSDVESIAEQVLLLRGGQLIAADTPSGLIEAVRPYVAEILCGREELAAYQEKYTVSNITQRSGKLLLQLVGRDLPVSSSAAPRVSLDDVYLFHMRKEA
jgi:cellulose biosynthesis protein BcsQ